MPSVSCTTDKLLEGKVDIEGEVRGLGLDLLGRRSESCDVSVSCVGGDGSILPVTVTSVVGVVGIGDLKSKANADSTEESDWQGWKVVLMGFLVGWNR